MPGPNTAGMYEAGLSGSFADHNRQGEWAREGQTLPCWEAPIMTSTSEGDSRHTTPTHSPDWNSTIIVTTGMTRGDGAGASYNSDLPNH
jgi:hypothetical protein